MRYGTLMRGIAVVGLLLAAFVSPALAQQQPEPTGWSQFLDRAHTGTIAVILIFGTGLVAVIGGMIPGIVRACRGEPVNGEELAQRVHELEQRMANLEQQHNH